MLSCPDLGFVSFQASINLGCRTRVVAKTPTIKALFEGGISNQVHAFLIPNYLTSVRTDNLKYGTQPFILRIFLSSKQDRGSLPGNLTILLLSKFNECCQTHLKILIGESRTVIE